MKKVFLILLFSIVSFFGLKELVETHEKNNSITHWNKNVYIKNKLYSSFNIDLNITNNDVIGNFCYVTHFGNRIDCDNKFKSQLKNKNIFFDFNSSFGGENGKAVISMNNNSISWKLLQEPSGKFYVPKKSILYINKN